MKDRRNFTKSIISVFSFGEREIEVVFNVIAELTIKVPHTSPLHEKASQQVLSFFFFSIDSGDENTSAVEMSYTHCENLLGYSEFLEN